MSAELTKWFITEIEKLDLWGDKAVRNPPSKHQRMIKDLLDLVEEYKLRYYEQQEKKVSV